jgi:predicted MPP superfamily phosphohydrolase
MALTRRAALKSVLATAVGTVAGGSIYGIGYERHRIGVTETLLPVRGLPPQFDGLRIALLTDIHHSALVPAEDVVRAVALANEQKPDLVILGGDYVTAQDRAFVEPVAELLAALEAPLGVFAILGNHDDDRDMPNALARRHMAVLKDQHTRIEVRGAGLELVGIRYWTKEQAKIAQALKGARDPVVLLAHDPRRVFEAAALNIPVVLSGHTHGGQIVIPGLGPVAARKFPVTAGIGSEKNTSLFVSRGIGTVYVPIRINCPPEVAIVTFRSASAL